MIDKARATGARRSWQTGAVAMTLLLAAAPSRVPPPTALRPQIGVYYFPGWARSDWGPKGGWGPIRPWTDRTPLLGWYDQGSPAVLARQLSWMADYGIDYVAMDWYYSQGAVRLDEGLRAYLATPQTRVKLALLWANHNEPTTPAIWRAVVGTWLDHYFRLPRYLLHDGRPVVFIFSFDKLAADAKASGSGADAYVATAQAMAHRAGFPGIFFVAGLDDFSPDQVARGPAASGFSAISAYQFHRKPQSVAASDPGWGQPTHGWAGLDAAYRAQWRAGSMSPLPMVVPTIAGLDRRPWGGFVGDPLHDRSIATPDEFARHLLAARAVLMRQGPTGGGMGVICCWNEYGEGAFIEPTVAGRFAKLQAVRRAFARQASASEMATPPARRR